MTSYDSIDEAIELGYEADVINSHLPREFPSGLRVWWIRNVPNKPTYYPVADMVEALHVYGRLVYRDLNDRDVTSNVGGLSVWDESAGDWYDWEYSLEYDLRLPGMADDDYIDSFDDVFDRLMSALRGEEAE